MYRKEDRVIAIRDVFRDMDNNKVEEFGAYHALAFSVLSLFYAPAFGASPVDFDTLAGVSGVKYSKDRELLKKALADLVDWKLMIGEIVEDDTKTVLYRRPTYNTNEFTIINAEMIKDIIYPRTTPLFAGEMLLVYVVLSFYMGRENYCFLSQQTLQNSSGLSQKKLKAALTGLKDRGIIAYSVIRLNTGHRRTIYTICDEPDYEDYIRNATKYLTK